MARKPLSGTVAATVLEHGTGALNIDGTRVGREDGDRTEYGLENGADAGIGYHGLDGRTPYDGSGGRWPANVVLAHTEECVPVGTRKVKGPGGEANYTPTGNQGPVPVTRNVKTGAHYGTETVTAWRCHPDCPVRLLDEQTGESESRSHDRGLQGRHDPASPDTKRIKADSGGVRGPTDSGGASRFFPTFGGSHERQEGRSVADAEGLVPQAGVSVSDGVRGPQGAEASGQGVQEDVRFRYVAKASRGERNAGLEGFEERQAKHAYGDGLNSATKIRTEEQAVEGVVRDELRNSHPT